MRRPIHEALQEDPEKLAKLPVGFLHSQQEQEQA